MKRLHSQPTKHPAAAFFCALMLLCIFPCTVFAADDPLYAGKTGNMSVIYGILCVLSLLLFLGYCFLVKEKNFWFILLYTAVFVVNSGYLALSLARDLDGALLANQISYFGAASLPLAMLMIIITACRIPVPRWMAAVLVLISLAAFLLAASGGYSDLYYKEVAVIEINGACYLSKVYGPLHFLYTVYLFTYFGLMIAAIAYAEIRKTINSCKYVAFLASAVFGNLVIWFVEQLIRVEFEFLSVSYIATELLLLSVHGMMRDYDMLTSMVQQPKNNAAPAMPPDVEELFTAFSVKAASLTATERSILQYYADGREIGEVAELAFISIHTVRKHNANIYQKLGVGSRDELLLYLDLFRRSNRLDEILQVPEKICEAN